MLSILVVLISFFTSGYLVLRDPWVQTLSARIASHYLSVNLHTDIRIGGFNLSILHGVAIEDVIVKDRRRVEIFTAQKLEVIPGKFSLSKKIFNIRKIFIEKGVIQLLTHRGDTDLNLKFIIDYFAPKTTVKSIDTVKRPGWHLSVSAVQLTATRFHLQDENKPLVTLGMDFSNIDVRNINLLITHFHPEGDTLNARIESLSATERSGISIHSMSGDFQVSPAFLKAHNLKLETNHSKLDLTFDFLYDHWNSYSDFLNKVHIKASINPSYLDLEDIGAFAPIMYVMKDGFKIEGKIKGTVNNFTAKDFKIAFGKGTRFFGNIHAFGLPNVEETFVDMNIKELATSQEDIRFLNLPTDDKNLNLPDFLKNAGTFNLKGTFTGFYNGFVANATLHTDIGDLKTDLTLRKQAGTKGLLYNGEADVVGLKLDQLFKSKKKNLLGPITLRADLNGRGFTLTDAIVSMNVWIDSVRLNDYTYRHLTLQGRLDEKKFNGLVNVDDDNLKLDVKGLVDLGDSLPSFNFGLQLNQASLFPMNILKRDSLEDLSTQVKVNFTGNSIDNIEGTIQFDSTRYREGRHNIRMNHLLLLTSRDVKNNKSYHLRSDFVDADISGNFYFTDMIPSLTTFINNYLASFELNDSLINHHPSSNQQLNYSIKLKKTDPVMEVFVPFLRIAPNTLLGGSYNENEAVISLNGSSPDITLFGNHLTNWFLKATSHQDNLNIQTGCNKLFIFRGERKDSVLIMMDSLRLVSNLHHDSVFYNISWNMDKKPTELGGFVNLLNSQLIQLKLTKFHTFIDHNYWSIANDNEVVIDSSSIVFHDLAFTSGDQKLQVNGKISPLAEDTLRLNFNKVDISDLDYLLGNPDVNIDGVLTGSLKLMNIPHSLTVLSDLTLEKFAFNKELLGDARFIVFYDDKSSRFDVDTRILYTGNAGTNVPLSLKGSYYLDKHDPHMNFNLSLKNLNLKMVSPFVSSFMSRLSGLVSGEVTVTGSPGKPILAGKLNLMRTEFKINYLNIPYSVVDAVTIDSTAFNFNHVTIFDSLGHKAYVSGKIYHNYLSRLELDLSIDPDDFSIFRNTYSQNNLFYGTARGSGNVRITGPADNISISAKAQTGGGTHVYIPISSAADIGQSDYIVFAKHYTDSTRNEDPYSIVTPNGLSLAIALVVNPSADVEVSFPNQMGNIKATGKGTLTMGMTPAAGFTLSGSYMIQKGSFLFQLRNLMRLNFSIENGSTIFWSGDPANANIRMNAIYKTRIPLGDLAGEEDKAKRVPVECIIRLSGELSNPNYVFSINLPDANENIKSMIFTAIDTNNVAEMNEQMINILILGQFKSFKGNTLGAIDVGSTSMSIFTNQVNSLLSQLSKDVNIGVNYRPSSTTAGQEIDVAVSTQLFNERLLIDGLFGVNSLNPNATAQKANTIVGDIKLEYILSSNRRWRIHAFNRTNTVALSIQDNNAPYTQGIGLSYQRDFTHWSELLKRDPAKTTEKPEKKSK